MTRFVQSEDRRQGVLLPEYLDDYVAEDNPVRVIDVFVDELDGVGALGFDGVIPEATGRPAYHPGALLKIYVYGYINQIASSRRLERETHRNVELMWLTGRLKRRTSRPSRTSGRTMARRSGGLRPVDIALWPDSCEVCSPMPGRPNRRQTSSRRWNARDKNFTKKPQSSGTEKCKSRSRPASKRYMAAAGKRRIVRIGNWRRPGKSVRLKDKIAALKAQMQAFKAMEAEVHAAPDQHISR